MKIEMQVRCHNCLREQYMPNVYPLSHGEGCCCWCGYPAEKMTTNEYYAKLDARRALRRSYRLVSRVPRKRFHDMSETEWMIYAVRAANSERRLKKLEELQLAVDNK